MFEYTVSFEDFKAAQRLCAQRNLKKKIQFILWFWVLPVLGVASAILLVWDVKVRHFGFSPVIGGCLAGLAWFGLYIPIRRPFYLRKLYKRMKDGRADDSTLELGVEGNQLVSRVPGLCEGRFMRDAITDFAEDKNVLIMFFGKKGFLMVPKVSSSDPLLAELREWLQSRANG